MEEWKDTEYSGYQVSSAGRVRTKDRMIVGKDGRSELHRGRVLKQQRLKNGYCEVSVSIDGKRRHRTVHSLVAETFLGRRDGRQDVMHLNGDRSDNRVENLSFGTRAENLHSTYDYGGKQATGKLSLSDVDEIRGLLRKGEGVADIARLFKVCVSTIYHVRDGKSFAWYEGGESDARCACASLPQ